MGNDLSCRTLCCANYSHHRTFSVTSVYLSCVVRSLKSGRISRLQQQNCRTRQDCHLVARSSPSSFDCVPKFPVCIVRAGFFCLEGECERNALPVTKNPKRSPTFYVMFQTPFPSQTVLDITPTRQICVPAEQIFISWLGTYTYKEA